ncbi:MAG: hypothetical protein JEZ07_11035 [Phycisphaerae bacterium]|nr:hypothetical protein [Phycisphaerae bacterium]
MSKNNTEFVVHCHQIDNETHWDLMLRVSDVLETWQLPCRPKNWLEKPVTAKKISDHRLKYLTYEGEISNNRGYCRIEMRGTYQILDQNPDNRHILLQTNELEFYLKMKIINNTQWLLEFSETNDE